MQSGYFEWDDVKAAKNLAKHGVTFEQAMGVFNDPNAMTFDDEDHSQDELRELTIGATFWSDVFTSSAIHAVVNGSASSARAARTEQKGGHI